MKKCYFFFSLIVHEASRFALFDSYSICCPKQTEFVGFVGLFSFFVIPEAPQARREPRRGVKLKEEFFQFPLTAIIAGAAPGAQTHPSIQFNQKVD